MIQKAFCLLLMLVLSDLLFASQWQNSDKDFSYVPGKIEFFNRSECAKKSLEPTQSVFMIVDNVNIAKSIYRLARLKGLDTVSTTNVGIEKFRYSLTFLTQIISAKLLNGTLSLVTNQEILKECDEGSCEKLDRLLEKNWSLSKKAIDAKNYSQCRMIKKFSTFNSHLTVSKPDRVLLEEIAREGQSQSDYYTSCDDFTDFSQPEIALYQFDLLNLSAFDFKNKGFEFWHSFKLYLSWAFRLAPEMKGLASPFDFLFQSANIEEMVLFFSNSCRSITHPTCSEKDLTLDNLRYLTKTTGTLDWSELDSVRHIPSETPIEEFSKPLPLLADDILNLGDSKTSDEWVKNFRDNFVRTRGYNKIKLSKAVNNLTLITQNASANDVKAKVLKDIDHIVKGQQDKQNLFYLCSEFSIAADKDLSFIRKDIWKLKDLKIFDSVFLDMTTGSLEEFWTHFDELAVSINQICKNLSQREIWDEEFELQKEGFAPWYHELVYERKFNFTDSLEISAEVQEKPYLKIQDGNVICQNGIHCARIVLNSIVSLSALSHNLSSLVPSSREALSNNMANPYSSLVACGAYDPWAKRNKVIYDFFHDMVQGAAFSLIPTPVYVAASFDTKKVVSFETLVRDGKVFYDPKFNKDRLKFSLIADIGLLTGVPCAISISGAEVNPYQYYMFNGISVGGCKERSKNNIIVSSGSDQENEKRYRQACATCAINLQTISASASVFNPIFRGSFFLIKGIVRLVNNLKDPNDLAKSWTVIPNHVALTYRERGEISKACTKKLIKGKSCLKESCSGDVLDKFTKDYVVSPTYSNFSCFRKRGYVEIKECDEGINIKFSSSGELKITTNCELKKRKE